MRCAVRANQKDWDTKTIIDGFARVASTEEKTIGAAIGTVGGLVSGMK